LTADTFLIVAPVLILGVVLVLGFAGCQFNPGVPPDPTLKFRVRVPADLTVSPGVTFKWTRPTSVMESELVTMPGQAGTDNVFEHEIPAPEAGAWVGSCEMTVDETDAFASSIDYPFTVNFTVSYNPVLAFHTTGSPDSPPFTIVVDGVS
jgi:hypothetical protein